MSLLSRFRKMTQILEPEDESTVSTNEQKTRHMLLIVYRFCWASFITWSLFDFLFSSVWMHGYIWTLNLPIPGDLSDKSSGQIVEHQLLQVGRKERIFHAILTTFAIAVLLFCSGFANGENKRIWDLLKVSINVGFICGVIRATAMKCRMFSCLHEGFYCYFIIFVIGCILTIQSKDEDVKIEEKSEKKEEEKKDK